MWTRLGLIAGMCAAFAACSHDFHLVDQDAGADGPRVDAGPLVDAGIDGPPGALQPVIGGLGTERLHSSVSGLEVFGGFSSGATACPATGLCVQGAIHP